MGDEFSREEIMPGIWDEDLNSHPESEYKFEASGYQCEIKRDMHHWTYCGYVQLPKTHPDFNNKHPEIGVHGELTYAKKGLFGFDCHHILMGDISPMDETMKDKHPKMFSDIEPFYGNRKHYWTYEEVKDQVESMAEQFKSRENL